MKNENCEKNNSGQTLIVLLVSVLIVALLSIYLINKLYIKKAEDVGKENGVDYEVPTLENAQNQVDSAREKIKNIENQRNSELENVLNQK